MELFAKIANNFKKHGTGVSSLIQVFSCEFLQNFQEPFSGTTFDCFWVENKYNNNTKMKQINIKQLYLTPFHLVYEKRFYRVSPVVASGHLQYFLSLLISNFFISPFRSRHWKCSIKKAVLEF